MAKYHINAHGEARPCGAKNGQCPFGGDSDHYSSPKEAREVYEAKNEAVAEPHKKVTVESELQITSVTAGNLQKGDDLNGSVVNEVKRGTKNATITLENGKKTVLPLDESVAVLREVDTPEQKEHDREEWQNAAAERGLAKARSNFNGALSRLNESIEKYGQADSFTYSNLIQAQETNALWNRVEHISNEKHISVHKAAQQVSETLQEGMTSGYLLKSGLSRSTSVVSNAIEDAKNEAIVDFVRNVKAGWY